MTKLRLLALGVVLGAIPVASAVQQDWSDRLSRVRIQDEDYAYILKAAVWRFSEGEEKVIFVCWENGSEKFNQEMTWVRDAVESTWEKHSGLSFLNWGDCAPRNAGIRIQIADVGPHVKKLGQQLDALPQGMVLNFTFRNWSQECINDEEYCIRSIAVHEFGHAIALAHEQNRFDAPGECRIMSQGPDGDLLLTPYDPNSVMNYCSKRWNNDGQLSRHDIDALQMLYCAPETPTCRPKYLDMGD